MTFIYPDELDSESFAALWPRWSKLFPDQTTDADRRASALADIVRHYSEPHRRYHNVSHLLACLDEFDSSDRSYVDSDVVLTALFYHDVFYDARGVQNEKRSAVHCKNGTHYLGRPELGAPAAECILATRHNGTDHLLSRESELVLDIDLSILGALPAVFDEYERQIREEYEWVATEKFNAARAGILQRFIDSPRIYRTHASCERLEHRARENINRSISKIRP